MGTGQGFHTLSRTNLTDRSTKYIRGALTLLAMPPTKTRFGISMPNFGAGDMRAELTVSRLGHGDAVPDTAELAYQHAAPLASAH